MRNVGNFILFICCYQNLLNLCPFSTGRISWVKIASNLPGRTDNSVLSRYKRLMTWKEKCEWVEEQAAPDREAMGLLNIPKTGPGGKGKTAVQKVGLLNIPKTGPGGKGKTAVQKVGLLNIPKTGPGGKGKTAVQKVGLLNLPKSNSGGKGKLPIRR